MSERDELATVIYDSAVPRDGAWMILADHAADYVLAAGYRNPRTITTAEELSALGAMCTILAKNGAVWINDGDSEEPWTSVVEDFHGGLVWANANDVALPATVLYEPTA